MEWKTLVFVAILTGAHAGSLNKVSLEANKRKCSQVCPESSKFNYISGRTYEFFYDSSFITALTGASEEVSGPHIKATVDIEVLSKCELALKLRNVRLEEVDPANPENRLASPGSAEMRHLLETETLRFAFQDGKVAELCHTGTEDWRALNIKRGVLSALQNTMDKLTEDKTTTETDVAGNCEVNYNVLSNSWGQIKISKAKKILGCTDRHGKQTSFHAMPYRVPSTIQSMPLMKSSHNCDQSFHTDGRLIQSSCKEVHTFRPFSYGKSGATTTVKQTLKYNTYRSGVSTNQRNVEHRTDLRFEHAYEGERLERDYRDVINQLREICSVAKDDVRPEVPRMFANLVYKMRRLNTEALGNVWRIVDDNRRPFCAKSQVARKYFLDAVPSCGTIASVSLIQKIISRDDLPAPMAVQWLNSLAFVSRPSKLMLAEVKPLVTVAKPSRQAVLAVSAMVNSYCRVNAECNDDSEVMDLFKVFEDNLDYDCKNTNKDQREKVLMSLKALGNTGHAMKAVDTLGRCITNKKEATDIRVAAIQAFRRLQCPFDYSKMMSVFRDAEEDTEIRAHAYLAVMRCADKNIIDNVKAVLESEKSNQIGTFVWTHLTNLMETSDPFKWTVREILEEEELSKEYNNDARKFSRNYEKSFFSQILNVGGKVESNVLFSTKSYVPRSATVNLTLDVFGESLNFLELEGRIEGFEYLVESFFGPNGYFQQNEMSNMLNRKRRNVIKNDDVQKVHSKFGAHMDDMTRGSASVKVFGNEIAFGEFAGFDPLNNKDTFNPLDILIKLASDQDIDYSKSVMFLDTSLIVPTMIGLPLNLTVNGTASINLKLGGHVDVRKLMTSPHEFDIDGHIKPSGAVEVSSVMTVDAFVARSGIKMVTTVHSSTFMDGKLSMKNGEFTFNLNTPKDKMEVFDVQSKFFIIHKEKEREQKMITGTRVEKKLCTGSYLERALGIRLCGELQFPNALSKSGAPFFPLTGPSKVSVVLHKPDSMEGYNFQAKYKTETVRRGGETYMKYMTSMGFNTPGSSIDRNIAVEYELNTADWSSKLEFVSPWKQVNLNGAYTIRDDLKRATLTMIVDEEKEYYFSAQLRTDQENKVFTYTPNLEVRIPERKPITLSGSVKYQKNKKYSGDLTLNKMFKVPVMFKVNLEQSISSSQKKLIGSVQLRSELFDSKVSGLLNFKPGKAIATRIEIEYNSAGKPKKSFVFSEKIRNLKPGSYSLNTLVSSDAYTDYNHQLAVELNFNKKHVDFEIDLNYGEDFRDKRKNIFISHDTDFGTQLPMKLESRSQLKFPGLDLLTTYDMSYNVETLMDHEMKFIGHWNNKKLNSSFYLKDESSHRLKKFTANGNLEADTLRLSFYDKFEQTTTNAFTNDLTLDHQGNNFVMQTRYCQPQVGKHTFSTSVQMANEEQISINGTATLGWKDFDASTSAQLRDKAYSTQFKLMKQPEGCSATSKLKLPGKRYSIVDLYTFNPRVVTTTVSLNVQGDEYSIEARLVNKNRSKEVLLSTNLLGNVYSAEAKMNMNSEEMSGILDLVFPTRQIKSYYKLSSDFPLAVHGQMSVNWDAGRDERKNVTLTGSYKNNSNRSSYKHLVNLRLIHPIHVGHFDLDFNSGEKSTVSAQWNREKISVTGEFKIRQYSSGPFVNSELSLASTIENLEDISLKFKYGIRATNYSVGGSFAWVKDKKVGGNLDVQYSSKSNIQCHLIVNTPFNDANTLKFVWGHKIEAKSIKAHTQVKVDAVDYKITVFGTDKSSPRRPCFEGQVNLKTPHKHVKDVTAKFTHIHDSRQINSSLEITLEPKEVITVSFTGEGRSQDGHDIRGKVTLETPWEELKDICVSLKHSDRALAMLNTEIVVKWDQVNVTINFQNRGKSTRDLDGSITIKTPFKGFYEVSLTATHKDDLRQFETGMTYRREGRKRAGFKFDMTHHARKWRISNTGKLDIAVPLPIFFRFAPLDFYCKWRHRSTDSMVDSEFSVQSPHMENITLTVNGQHIVGDRRTITANVALKTPFQPVEDVAFSLYHQNGERDFKLNSTVQLSDRKTIVLTADLQENNKNITSNFMLKTPFAEYFSSKVNIQSQSMTINANFGPHLLSIAALDGSLNISNGFNGHLSLMTPSEKFLLTANHEDGIYSTRATFKYASGRRLYLRSDVNFNGKFVANLRFKSPFENFESIEVSFSYSGEPKNFSSHAEVIYAPNGKLGCGVSFDIKKDILASLNMSTPFKNFEDISVNVVHKGFSWRSISTMAVVKYSPRNTISVSTTFRLAKTSLLANIKFSSPFKYFEQLSAEVNHNGGLSAFETTGEVSYAHGKTISVSAAVKNSESRVESEGNFTLKTPFDKFENLQVILRNHRKGEQYQSSFDFTWAHGKTVSIQTTFQKRVELYKRNDTKFYVFGNNTVNPTWNMFWKMDQTRVWNGSANTRIRWGGDGRIFHDVTVNSESIGNEDRGFIEMTKPLTRKVEFWRKIDVGNVAAEAIYSEGKGYRMKRFRFTLDVKNQDKEGQFTHDTVLKMLTPYRTAIFEHKIVLSSELIQHNTVYCWDPKREKQVAHELTIIRGRHNWEMSNKLISPWRSLKHTASFTVRGRVYEMDSIFFWNADKDESKKVKLKGKHERFGNTIKQELGIRHPKLRHDITIQNEVNTGEANSICRTNTEIKYSGDHQKKFTVSTNIRKEAIRFSGTNYTMLLEIRHPASSLDISGTTQLGNSDRFWTAGIGIWYSMSRSHLRKSFLLNTKINKLRNEVELQILSPRANWYNWAKMKDLSNKKYKNIHMEMRNTYNHKTVSSSFDIDLQKRLVDLKINYDLENPVNQLHVYAKFNNDSAVTAEVYRIHNSNKVTDGLFTARLNNSRLMHSRIHWRPSALFDIKDTYYAVNEKVYFSEGSMFAVVAEEASEKMRRTQYQITADVEKIAKQLDMDREMRDLEDDFNQFSGEIFHMIRRNDFFSRDILDYVAYAHDLVVYERSLFVIRFHRIPRQMQKLIGNYIAHCQVRLEKYHEDVATELIALYETLHKEMNEQMTEVMRVLKAKAAEMMDEALIKASVALKPYVITCKKYPNIASEKIIKLMQKTNIKFQDMMTKLRSTAYYQEVMAKVEQLLEKYHAILNHLYAEYLPEMPEIDYRRYYNHVRQKAQQKMNTQALRKAVIIVVELGKWVYDNYELERHAQDIAVSLCKDVQGYVLDTARDVANEYLRFDDTRFTVWNPKQGEIQMEVGLPFTWESFVTVPKYENFLVETSRLKKTMRLPNMDMMYLDKNTVMDYVYQYKPTRDYMNWIPPFKAHATIAGQHITTFDHRHYEFKGTCSYILAHDFIDGNFTILVNYHAKRGKSLVILTDDKEVQLRPYFTVRLNGKKTDMPVQFGNTTIMRIGNAIRVHNTNGVTVTCDNVHDVCTTNVTGWYYGKTAGLFGTYDNEPSNDFTTVQNREAENTLEFTRSWALRCRRHQNNANINTPMRSGKIHSTCAALFEEESSSLRPCFKVVDPSKYYTMCCNDMSSSKKNSDDETLACNVAANYIVECSVYDVYVRHPRHCVKCETGDKKKEFVIEGEDFTISKDAIKSPKSADVVLVVEEKPCNKKTVKRLQDIVKNIGIALRKQGIINNHFGLVGFGGEGVHNFEQSHTMDGQLFNTYRLFKKGVNTLDIGSGGSNNDVIRAIRMASMYPFRAGVAKVIVTLPCSACGEASVSYSEIRQLLIENLIQLHVIAGYDFAIKGNKSYNYYGIDTNKIYAYKKIIDKSSLRKHISVPKDLCVALAHETNGSMFNLNAIAKKSSIFAKKIISVFAKRVAATAKPAERQICHCVADELGVGKSICRSCEMSIFKDYSFKITRSKLEEGGDDSGTDKPKPHRISASDAKVKKKPRKSRG